MRDSGDHLVVSTNVILVLLNACVLLLFDLC